MKLIIIMIIIIIINIYFLMDKHFRKNRTIDTRKLISGCITQEAKAYKRNTLNTTNNIF